MASAEHGMFCSLLLLVPQSVIWRVFFFFELALSLGGFFGGEGGGGEREGRNQGFISYVVYFVCPSFTTLPSYQCEANQETLCI